MTVEKPFHHRSSLKQKNKPFKGSSRSQSRGRVARKKPSPATTPSADLCKRDRRNRATMMQHSKREELAAQRRIYASRDGMPRIIAIIPVSSSVQMDRVLPFATSETIYSERNKQNLHFVPVHREGLEHSAWIMRILDVAQVADCVLLAASSLDADLDGFGRDALALIRGIGASSTAAVIQHLSSHKHPQQMRSAWLNILQASFSSVGKAHCADSMFQEEGISREAVELERTLCQQHLNGLSWRDIRPYMVANIVGESDDTSNTVKVTGFIRGGKAFSANKLVYLPFLGTHHAVSRVEAVNDVVGRGTKRSDGMKRGDSMDVDEQVQLRGEGAETLDAECASDIFSPNAMMQAAEEMAHNCDDGKGEPSVTKMVPKGTSAYQAAWLDEEAESFEDGKEPLEEINPDTEESSSCEGDGNDMAVEEYEAQLAEYKLQFSERHFPDEIELDPRISARTRLQKYRGVQSLRTSTWDANENLPPEYGRIFRFANYKQSRKAALEGEEEDSPFHVGQRVTIYIEGIPADQAMILRNAGRVALFGLLKYEQRQTVLNFTLNRNKTYNEAILNKEEMIAVIGMQRFIVNPVWSEGGTGNLHKMIRTVGVEQKVVVGTIYAPVAYTPCPILILRPDSDSGELRLVGSGSLLDVDPHRIVLKRITLAGTPFRVHKRSAVIRFMFSNPTDVLYFKPVELATRSGARGHIRESLGTHGYMKCLFDRAIFHHDTVAMHLYKRVFPKWTTRSIGSV